MSDPETPPAVSPPPAPPVNNNKGRNRNLIILTSLIVFAVLIWFLLWLFYFRFHESTDDAYANGNMVNVTSAIPGTPIAYFADNTDLVEKGQLLILLDPTKYSVDFEREKANLAATVLQVKQLYDSVNENKANVESKKATLAKAKFDYESRSHLTQSGAVSEEDFIHAKEDFNIADLAVKQAEYQLQMAIDAAGPTPFYEHPLIEAQKNSVRAAYYNLVHCSIYAPVTGFVAQRAVQVGQWVNTSDFMMAIIPIDYVWVDANFKETQLTHMRIGQPASVTLDIFGSSINYNGIVLGIASGTGSVFSLIPPQNATGNWIKIVQRLPVRIGLDPEIVKKFPLRLGLSAVVDVNITNSDGPMLAEVPSKKVVAETDIFKINFDELEKTIHRIIQG